MPIFHVPAMTLMVPAITVDGQEIAPGYSVTIPGIEIEVPGIPSATIRPVDADLSAIAELLKADPWDGLKDLRGMPEMNDPRWN